MPTLEIWKDIPNYEGHYQVSNFGRVKSLIGWNGHNYIRCEKILSIYKRKNRSYIFFGVKLKKNGKGKDFRVHRLVALAFIPNPKNKTEVNHIDFNPLNNCVNNLEWCTPEENKQWNVINRRCMKLSIEQEQELIRLYKTNMPKKQILKKYNITDQCLYDVLNRNNIKKDKLKRGKYAIDLNNLLKDFKKSIPVQELIKKYKCSKDIVYTRKYQFRKKGLL